MRPTEDDIWNKENGADNIVLIAGETEVLVHAFNFCVSNVSSIDMTQ